MFGKPEVNAIEEVEARPIDQAAAGGLLFGPEEDGGGKKALEALNQASVIAAVLGKAEELEDLSGAFKMHRTALLPQGKGSHPDGDEAVLAEGQAEVGMADKKR